ncbi:bifunctional protein tyrosine phosphatase family protein/NAD(P)/FAD-dependent oxidoreductase [Ferruginivarius sediminum]|uniref:TIGR01244 family phosphatase n=1 Tax=Ferruginivarius sediminum TaxID=2661937 RepID=A0A369TB54_9PROT|nr:bifunctional protein tyrosine phosphatase family protein/NAD(P)/FAD-dependent oxidoreductase [Ferruginivarius sediminum]RDD61407.1 TIGR01244 family phosphatase [Ferruginivarius sediminum]
MKVAKLTPFLSVSPQINEADMGILAAQGFRAIVNNRPDGESDDQPGSEALRAAAERQGLAYRHIPVVSGRVGDEDVGAFADALGELNGPVLAFCRTGTRSTTLWALSEAYHLDPNAILRTTAEAGYDLEALRSRLETRARTDALIRETVITPAASYDVVIVGGGSGGIAAASSLLGRRPDASIAVVEPRESHYYQPGWTLVGGGVFKRGDTERPMASAMPKQVKWVKAAVASFEPERNRVVLEDGEHLAYRTLIVSPGIELNWQGIEGLQETLGRNGVTSNYMFEMAPYTWDLVQSMRSGRAIFTQPPMPIKCAGAPQKAAYLSCCDWEKRKVLGDIDVEFHTAGGVLFGVKEFVPALMTYVERYGIDLNFQSDLAAVDGPARKAWFKVTKPDGSSETVEKDFDMLHVCPPQRAPAFIRNSPLADANGWVEVSPETLQHSRYSNVFGIGDASSAPNAKTAAAVRKQAPVAAMNAISVLDGEAPRAIYDGYGSCPLTVERGKIVLAEFGYGGKLLPTFPWDPTKPRRINWFLKEKMLPWIYWDLMLKGREWLAKPELLPHAPAAHEAPEACDFSAPKARAKAS